MFSLLDRIPSGVEPMLTDVEAYIVHSGIDDMKASVEIITTVRGGEGEGRGRKLKVVHLLYRIQRSTWKSY